MYFVWEYDTRPTVFAEGFFDGPERFDDLPVLGGASMAGRFPEPLRLRVKCRSELPDAFQAGPLFIVSQRLRDAMEKTGVVAEYFRAELEPAKKSFCGTEYWCANLLERVACLDLACSQHTVDRRWVRVTGHIAIDEVRAGKRAMFILDETTALIRLVSQPLRDVIVAGNLTGMKLVAVDAWLAVG
jgi:hypothetical protein